jgi:predicted nucleic acid-binding protein
MPLEPGVIDANVLAYAMDADASQHVASRTLLEAARDPSIRLCVTSQILCEFYSIVTNARRVPNPRSPDDALRAISGLLDFLLVLPVPARTVEGWLDLVRRHPVTGGDVFDLQIIATMQANGVLFRDRASELDIIFRFEGNDAFDVELIDYH